MAAAVTSGVVALMIEANKATYDVPLTPNTVKAILEYTALPLYAADPLTQGAGGLNGGGAVQLAETIDPGRPIGDWWMTAPLDAVDVNRRSAICLVTDGGLGQHRGLGKHAPACRTTWPGDKLSCGARRSYGEARWCGAARTSCGTTRPSGARPSSGAVV